jgi:nitrogenase molybdenum-cofactor synthesis protein NifE
MTVVATGTRKSTEDDKARIRELMGDDALMIEDGNPRALINLVWEHGVDMLIAGGRNMYTALKARIPFLDINQEREFGYAGYAGMVELARQLCLTIESPVWEAVRRSAPWAAGGNRRAVSLETVVGGWGSPLVQGSDGRRSGPCASGDGSQSEACADAGVEVSHA